VAVLAAFAAAAAVGTAVWMAHSPGPTAPESVPQAAVRMSRAQIVLRQQGEKQAEITADRVEVSGDQRTTTFTGRPSAVIHLNGVPALTATGGRIVLDRQDGSVRIKGGLRIVTVRGEILSAPDAAWNPATQVVELTGGVTASASHLPAAHLPMAGPSSTPQPRSDIPGRLRAERVRYDARAQVVVASGNVALTLGEVEIRADALRLEQVSQVATAEGRVSVQRRDQRLTAPAVRYELRTETAEASGGVVLVQKDTTIRAPQMRFDIRGEVTTASGGVEASHGSTTMTAASLRHEARTGEVMAEGGVTLAQPGSRVTGGRMQANLVTMRADVREDATLIRPDTTVTAARIVFRWDINEAEAERGVVVRQPGRTAWADRMTYSEPADRAVLTGRVVVEQPSGEGLVRLTCNRMVMTLRDKDITAEGQVTVVQKDRRATGDRGTYTDATRILVVTGNVRMQDADGTRLKADRAVISLADETFEAEGNVETEFVVRPSPTRRP
jgi:lipopolysaccharide transport protein LptA